MTIKRTQTKARKKSTIAFILALMLMISTISLGLAYSAPEIDSVDDIYALADDYFQDIYIDVQLEPEYYDDYFLPEDTDYGYDRGGMTTMGMTMP